MPRTRNQANRGPPVVAAVLDVEIPAATPIATPAATPVVTPVVAVTENLMEDFGQDKNLKTLLKSVQPKAFTGEGTDIPKILEEWIIAMDDYFALAEYNTIAQGIMGRAKIEGSAKLWWKLHCQTQGRVEITMSWEELKTSLKERYLPLNHSTVKMNEFLSCVRKGRSVTDYYEEFVKLSRYAPLMTEEQKLSRFILGLEGQLAEEVNAL